MASNNGRLSKSSHLLGGIVILSHQTTKTIVCPSMEQHARVLSRFPVRAEAATDSDPDPAARTPVTRRRGFKEPDDELTDVIEWL